MLTNTDEKMGKCEVISDKFKAAEISVEGNRTQKVFTQLHINKELVAPF